MLKSLSFCLGNILWNFLLLNGCQSFLVIGIDFKEFASPDSSTFCPTSLFRIPKSSAWISSMMISKKRRKIRQSLWLKSPYCYVCQREILNFSECTLEHVLPKSLGGGGNRYNHSISHKSCNHLRGNIMCRLLWQMTDFKIGFHPRNFKLWYGPTNLNKIMKAWREKYQFDDNENSWD